MRRRVEGRVKKAGNEKASRAVGTCLPAGRIFYIRIMTLKFRAIG